MKSKTIVITITTITNNRQKAMPAEVYSVGIFAY